MKPSALALLLVLTAGPIKAQPCTEPRFAAPVRLCAGAPGPDPGGSWSIATGDFDGDGWTDVAAIDRRADEVVVLRANGPGTFRAPAAIRPGGRALGVGDFDGDGRSEIAVVRDDEVQILSVGSDGGLEWAPSVPLAQSWHWPVGPAIGDFNGDGLNDLVILQNTTPYFLPGDGNRSFSGPRPITTAPVYYSLAVVPGDFDGNGTLDLWLPSDYRRGMGSLLYGDGRGTFSLVGNNDFSEGRFATAADFDKDGIADQVLAIQPYGPGGYDLRVKFGPEAGWTAHGLSVGALAVGDFDGDGNLDIAAGSPGTGTVFVGDGHRAFPRSMPLYVDGSIVALDVDRDGRSDLVSLGSRGDIALWRNTCGSVAPDLVLPAVVSVDGEGNTHFESEVTFANRSPATMTLELNFAGSRATWTLAPGEKTFATVADLLRGTGLSLPSPRVAGQLAIRVLVGAPSELAARVRTTSQVPGRAGRGGVAYSGIPSSQTLRSTAFIPWLAEDAAHRSNLAILNSGSAADGPITVEIRLGPLDASSGDVHLVTVEPGASVQVNRVLSLESLARGYARLERISGRAPWFAYAVVNDNATGDGSWEDAIDDDALVRRRGALFVPAVVENARYESELVVTNAGNELQQLEATWRPRGHPAAIANIDVAPGGQVDLPGFVQRLREAGVPGIAPRGADLAGAVELRSASGDVSRILAGARTATTTGFGVFTPAVSESEAAFGTGWLFGLRQDAEVRSNLALLNVSTFDAKFTLEIHAASGGASWTMSDVFVGARQWLQLDRFLAEYGAAQPGAFVEVIGNSAAGSWPPPAFLTYGVMNEGAEPGQGSGDGSYVPMQTW